MLFSVTTLAATLTETTWEYFTKTFPLTGDDQALTNALNILGKDHWELVDCSESRARLICIFKRPLEEE
ncbi:MAG: hypothetical protein COA78_24210 [Blastopirellula sp.]|nr:MAG: hypothetical protein COA78_24210 [Blastopirellula sp.]